MRSQVPPAAVYELQRLCDEVPPFDTAAALRTVEASLGRPVAEVCAQQPHPLPAGHPRPTPTFAPQPVASSHPRCDLQVYRGLDATTRPIAAASLGQVYKVELLDTGEGDKLVALKVQRPDMIRAVALDMYVLRRLSAAYDVLTTTFTRQPPCASP
eukprot:SAG11_NODE_12875_length_681_cov_1.986254_1_plen_156_part_00